MKKLLVNKKNVIIYLLFLALVASSVYFYGQYQKTKKQLQNPNLKAGQEKNQLLTRLGQFMVLPEGEEPTIATVSDSEKLKDQPFFAQAKNGDKVIIYVKAQKAILYDNESNRIVDIVTLNLTNVPTTGTPSASLTPEASPTQMALIKLALYNGTKINGLTKKAEQFLTGKIAGFEVTSRGNAQSDYTKNLVVDLSGDNLPLVTQISELIKGEIESLPEDETKPEADILIILGEDNFQ